MIILHPLGSPQVQALVWFRVLGPTESQRFLAQEPSFSASSMARHAAARPRKQAVQEAIPAIWGVLSSYKLWVFVPGLHLRCVSHSHSAMAYLDLALQVGATLLFDMLKKWSC